MLVPPITPRIRVGKINDGYPYGGYKASEDRNADNIEEGATEGALEEEARRLLGVVSARRALVLERKCKTDWNGRLVGD